MCRRRCVLAARNPTLKYQKKGLYYSMAVYTVQVSLNDTVTLPHFSTQENLKFAALIGLSDGAEIACTHAALNVVTVTGASTDDDVALYAYGRKVN